MIYLSRKDRDFRMIYVISNLYGDYERYKAILKKIEFEKEDILFVLGDIVDGGSKGIEILMDMMMRDNVYPISGEHDLIAYEILSGIEEETHKDITAPLSKKLADRCQMWCERGGEGTMEGFAKLSDDDKRAVIEYMEEFSVYEEVEADGVEYVLCHNMPEGFIDGESLDDYTPEEILSGKVDYERDYFPGRVLVTAEDVTDDIDMAASGRIYKSGNHVCINCGDTVAAYCLDTGEEFYV